MQIFLTPFFRSFICQSDAIKIVHGITKLIYIRLFAPLLPISNAFYANFAVLEENQDTSRVPNNNKQPCSCQTSLRNLLFHLIQRISLHFKSPDLYLFCAMKVFPKFLLPFESPGNFQSGEFGSYDYAPWSLSLVTCSLSKTRVALNQCSVIFSEKEMNFLCSNYM